MTLTSSVAALAKATSARVSLLRSASASATGLLPMPSDHQLEKKALPLPRAVEVAILVLAVSAATGVQGLFVVRRAISFRRLAPFLIPAFAGIPFGLMILDQIDARSQRRDHQLSASIEWKLGYDSNVNSATEERTISLPIGLTLELGDYSRQLNDDFSDLTVSANYLQLLRKVPDSLIMRLSNGTITLATTTPAARR